MRVLVLGGAGAMGRRAVQILAQYEDVTQITVAGRRVERAQAVVAELGGGPRLAALRLDASDHAALVQAIAGHDVVASALGPFYRFEAAVARACIEAGVDCVSICDDYDGAEAVLQLHDQAAAAGRRILTGFGWTPGLTNLAAVCGLRHMDKPEAIDVAWAAGASETSGEAVLLHMFHALSGRVPSFAGGKPQHVKAGSGALTVPFPEPVGTLKTYHCGHPEPVTLPRFVPGLERVTLRGAISEPFANWIALTLGRLGLVRTQGMRRLIGRITLPLIPVITKIGPRKPPTAGMWVQVHGRQGWRRITATYRAAASLEDMTAIPLAVAAVWLGRGRIGPVGVLAPETPGAIDPDAFLAEVGRFGIVLEEKVKTETIKT